MEKKSLGQRKSSNPKYRDNGYIAGIYNDIALSDIPGLIGYIRNILEITHDWMIEILTTVNVCD